MTNKLQAFISGIVAGIAALISWLATVPPEQQTGILAPFVACLPETWRPQIGLFMRLLATAGGIWGTFKASQSGPGSPPKNPPGE